MKKQSTTQYQLNQLVDFVAKYHSTFEDWKDETRYAVFAKRKRFYGFPRPNYNGLVILHDYDKPDAGNLEYLGSFYLRNEHKKAVEDVYGKPFHQIISTVPFHDNLSARFEYERVARYLRYLADFAQRKAFSVLLVSVGNVDVSSVQFAAPELFEAIIHVPVHHTDRSDVFKINNGRIAMVTTDTYPDTIEHFTVNDITQNELAPLAISTFMFFNTEYVLLDVNAVLQNQRLLERYRPQMALFLLHEFASLFIMHKDHCQKETEKINRALRRVLGDKLDLLKFKYMMGMIECPFTKAMKKAYQIYINSKEYDSLIKYVRIPSGYFMEACKTQYEFEKSFPAGAQIAVENPGIYVVS